jgi:hypothetical protein
MPGKFDSFKAELQQLGLFVTKLIIHCFVLLLILLFVLAVAWIHLWFQRSYSELERQKPGITELSVHKPVSD